jgi:hypothetical protein
MALVRKYLVLPLKMRIESPVEESEAMDLMEHRDEEEAIVGPKTHESSR